MPRDAIDTVWRTAAASCWRALYREPKILVPDEGTANLDDQNENLIDQMSIMRIDRRLVVGRVRQRCQALRQSESCQLSTPFALNHAKAWLQASSAASLR